MSKTFAAVAVLLLASAAPALAQTVEWRGAVVLTAVAGCGNVYQVTNAFPIRYRPSGIGTNGTKSKFAVHTLFFAQSFVANGRFRNTLTAVSAGALGAGWGAFATPAKFRMTSITPANHTASTASLAFVGEIQNFGDTAGCNVKFRASAALRP